MAEGISSLPCSFYIRKNCGQRIASSISRHEFVATWPRIEKTYNIFWMVSKPGYLSPATQFPGCSPSQRCSSTNPPEIYVLCLPYRSLYFSIARPTIKKLERERPFLFIRWKETFSRCDLFYASVLTYLVGPVLYMEYLWNFLWRMKEICWEIS